MKRLVLMFIPALIFGMVFTSCSTDKAELPNGIKEGIFSGTFTVTYLTSWANSGSGEIEVKLKNGKYTCIGLPHNQANISGYYSISNDKILFEINVWETDYIDKNGNIICFNFDTYIIPQGECYYTFEGNKLILSKVYDDFADYEWNLVRKLTFNQLGEF